MPKHPSTCATQADSAACEVAIVIEAATSFSRGVLRGVSQWMARHPGWLITVADRRREDPMPSWLTGWSGDGMISGLSEHDLPRTWRGSGRPVVYVRDRLTE